VILSFILIIAAGVLISQGATFVTTIYLHRALAHHALKVHPVMDLICRTFLWLATGMSRQQWVAVHRKHHAFTDKEGDPHSPLLLGFWKVQLFNFYYYVREARDPEVSRKFAPDLEPDIWDRTLFSWGWTGLTVGTVIVMLTLGWWQGLLAVTLHGLLYVGILSPLINGLGHWWGKQNFMNTAYNSRVLAWFTGGESLHNNHHAYPRSPKFSVGRFEFDPSWPLIKLMAALRMVSIVGAVAQRPVSNMPMAGQS